MKSISNYELAIKKCQAVQMIVKESSHKQFLKIQSANLIYINSMVMVLGGFLCHIHHANKKELMHWLMSNQLFVSHIQ
jgi:hypothetical protein